MENQQRVAEEHGDGIESPDSVGSFDRNDVVLIDATSHRYTFVVSDSDGISGTLVGGQFDEPCAAALLGSIARDSLDFAPRALKVGLCPVFSVTMEGGRRLYRISEVSSLRRVMVSGVPAPP